MQHCALGNDNYMALQLDLILLLHMCDRGKIGDADGGGLQLAGSQ